MISVCILTKNNARTLEKTLDSIKDFPEVLLLDNGSTDQTLEIASKYPNVRVEKSPFIGFGSLRNLAASLAKNDWILALDADEVLSPTLASALLKTPLLPSHAYSLNRHNYYNNRLIRGCGWGPEQVARLYNREIHSYCNSAVHESLQASSPLPFKEPLLHTPYLSTEDFLAKMQHYTTLFAQQNKGREVSFSRALFAGLWAFFRSYFLKRGFLLGKEGFTISIYNGNTAFYKYLKLLEINRQL